MSGGGGSTTTTTTEIPDYIDEFAQETLDFAGDVAGRDYEAYEGQRVAGTNEDYEAGFDATRSATGIWEQPYNEAYGVYSDVAGSDFTTADIDAYMNPYTETVLDRTLEDLLEQQDIEQNQLKGDIALSGAYGGSRHGVIESELAEDQSDLYADVLYSGLEDAYNDAAARYYQDFDVQMQGAEGLTEVGEGASELAYGDAAAMLDIGEIQRLLEQEELDVGYEDFLRQWEYPYDQLNTLIAGISGVPYETTQTAEQDTGSDIGGILGGFGTLAGGIGTAVTAFG